MHSQTPVRSSLIALILLASTSGCAFLEGLQRDPSVAVRAQGKRGRGAILGPNRVMTVQHVVGSARRVRVGAGLEWTEARVVRRFPCAPEALVELELEQSTLGFSGFAAARCAQLGQGGPAWIHTPRGRMPWGSAELRRGDSGSPVFDAQGGLVGLLHGRELWSGRPIAVQLSSTTFGAGPLARRANASDELLALARARAPRPLRLR
ncbi:MAG TPA: hypothetical protein DEA08_15300 [Planctomycetes bacterium]|nr:hypothetical protein [Planctomycetota bacterium]